MKQIRQETDFDKKSSHEPFAQVSPNFKKQKCWTKWHKRPQGLSPFWVRSIIYGIVQFRLKKGLAPVIETKTSIYWVFFVFQTGAGQDAVEAFEFSSIIYLEKILNFIYYFLWTIKLRLQYLVLIKKSTKINSFKDSNHHHYKHQKWRLKHVYTKPNFIFKYSLQLTIQNATKSWNYKNKIQFGNFYKKNVYNYQ